MDNLFEFAQFFLYQASTDEQLSLTHQAWRLLSNGELQLSANQPALPITQVKFPDRPELLPPRLMPNRKLNAPGGIAAFFHAIAHIEFIAIYLAWDIIYRFRNLPDTFYQDWLRVADEEAQHFELIREHLQGMGVNYGDLPAHSGLWSHANDTKDDVLARLALVPRCLEARGLDVTPGLIDKFKQLGDTASVALLNRILVDEIGHVERGSFWFKTLCIHQGFEPETQYRQLIGQYYLGGKPKGPFNHKLRLLAGFSATELEWLERN
ncbi:MAG: ferritin-like domain-containing protein [Methylovulum sp.]|nr:ferritin-like domain-containing protein [Methylovulum sp.]